MLGFLVFSFSRDHNPISFAKAHPALNSQNAKYITSLGNLCSGIVQLPASATLSEGLEKHGKTPLDPGGFTDTWKGYLPGETRVVIKVFRKYSDEDLEKAKKVRI